MTYKRSKMIDDKTAEKVICKECGAIYPGVKYYIKRNRAVITHIPKGPLGCWKCIEDRLSSK